MEEEKCEHEFIDRDYLSAPYGRCMCCGQLIIDSINGEKNGIYKTKTSEFIQKGMFEL